MVVGDVVIDDDNVLLDNDVEHDSVDITVVSIIVVVVVVDVVIDVTANDGKNSWWSVLTVVVVAMVGVHSTLDIGAFG